MRRPHSSFPERIEFLVNKHAFALLVAGLICFFLFKCVAIAYFIPKHRTIFDLEFGFGPYVRSLVSGQGFISCGTGWCNTASRMPLLPFFYYPLTFLSQDQQAIALIKTTILSIGSGALFLRLHAVHRNVLNIQNKAWLLVIPVALNFPNVIKHASAISYEEGFLIEILFVWSYAALLGAVILARRTMDESERVVALSLLALSTAAFFTKASMLPILLLSYAITIYVFIRRRDIGIGLCLMVCIGALLSLAIRNDANSGRFTVMTSWDGENLFRGWNSAGLQIYPEVSLDRLLDAQDIYRKDGTIVQAPLVPQRRQFNSEWAWNDYYKNISFHWGVTHPLEALIYTEKKIYVMFFSVDKTPSVVGNDARIRSGLAIKEAGTMLWLIFGRTMQVLMIFQIYRLLRSGRRELIAIAAGGLTILTAYSIPYLVGFGYERHVTPLLVMVAVCVAVFGSSMKFSHSAGSTFWPSTRPTSAASSK